MVVIDDDDDSGVGEMKYYHQVLRLSAAVVMLKMVAIMIIMVPVVQCMEFDGDDR